MLKTRRVTVFGGSGFVGRYIVQRLAAEKAVVTVVGRHASQARYLQPMGDVGQIVRIDASLEHEAVLRRAVEHADAVINLVGILAEGGKQGFDRVMHQGAARVARLAADAKVADFVQVSAIGADAQSPSRYARAKAAGEASVRETFPAAIVLRPSIVFGPEDKFFNRFAQMTRLAPFLPLIGGGNTRFQPVYVGDVADAALAVLDLDKTRGKTYELGGPRIYTFRELMELMLRHIGRPDHRLLDIPFGMASLMAGFAQWAPGAPLTPDQVTLLKRDNVVSPGALTLDDLHIEPTAPDVILPTYLDRYRRGGWYSTRRMA